jgi:hypothetical protein
VVADALSRPPPAAAQQPPTAQLTSSTPTTEDWPEEGLVTLERPILAAIAEAQAVDFSAMAALQRSCPEVKDMVNSNTLQITTQGLLVLPVRHGSHTRPPTTSRYTGPSPPFAHIHFDLVGPLPPSRVHTYLFTIIDRTSRWPEAIPLSSITAADCARALFAGWVSKFGVPATITSDMGAQFTSALWAALCGLLNSQHSPTTAYQAQSNGLVERFHRQLKDTLRSRSRRLLHQHYQRSCCWPASFWSAGTVRSRRCPRSRTDLTECWSGQHISFS